MKLRQLKNKLGSQIFIEDSKDGCFVYHSLFNLPNAKKIKKSYISKYFFVGISDLKKRLVFAKNSLEKLKKTERIVLYFDKKVFVNNHYAKERLYNSEMILYSKIYLLFVNFFLLYFMVHKTIK